MLSVTHSVSLVFSGKGKTNKKGDEIEDKQRSAFFFFQIDPRSSSQVASVPARMNHQRKKRKEHFDLTPQSFVHALLPLRGKRFLTIKKNKTFLLKTIRPTSNKLYGELKLNNLGYCAFEVFKDDNEEKILESYFFHGPRVEIDIHLTWPEEFHVDSSEYHFCIQITGKDFRQTGNGAVGEVFIFVRDTGTAERIKNAAEALANAAKPLGECKFKKRIFEDTDRSFVLDHKDEILILRACSLVLSLEEINRDFFFETALSIESTRALAVLQDDTDDSKFDPDKLKQFSGLFLRALMEALNKMKIKPLNMNLFDGFCTRAGIAYHTFKENINDSVDDFTESEELAEEVTAFLKDLHSREAVLLIKEVTRVIKHLHVNLNLLILDCTMFFGPLLLDRFKQSQSREMTWFFASLCSHQREKIFLKSLTEAKLVTFARKKPASISEGNSTPLSEGD